MTTPRTGDGEPRSHEPWFTIASTEAFPSGRRQLGTDLTSLAPLVLDTWSDAVTALMQLGAEQPRLVVIDEFPFLMQAPLELSWLAPTAGKPKSPGIRGSPLSNTHGSTRSHADSLATTELR